MEVTRKNFKKQLNNISESIRQASFIAIDGEFTGLDSGSGSHIMPYDTPEERYHKVRQGAANFLLFQFGLCTFHFNEKKKRYYARPFNFYLFPRPYTKSAPDYRFSCQSSSIDFLSSQGFDFNKVFKEGINFMNQSDEASMREALKQKHEQFSHFSSPAFVTPDGVTQGVSKGPVNVPEEHEEFIKGVCEQVSEFIENSTEPKLELSPCTAFQRKLIYQTVRGKFSSGVHLETKTGEGEKKKERFIVVTRINSEEDMKKKEQEKQAAEVADLDDAVGFTKVVRMISESGKMVAGHNMLLDLIHVLHQFYYTLPETYEDFKAMVACTFPKMVDTKLMASTNPFKELIFNTTLGDLQKLLQVAPFKKPNVVIDDSFPQYSLEEESLHEAGYDAYITGLCFICMANYLGSFQKPPDTKVQPSSPLIQPFLNKIFLMRVNDIPYMDLAGPDLAPSRDHVFHVQFPKEWKTTDLYQLFSPYGNIQIGWLDDISAYVTLHHKEEAPKVTEALCSKTSTIYRVMTYQSFKMTNQLWGPNASRKRISGASESMPPPKKRKSLNADAPPFVSRSITPPIPEENDENKVETVSAEGENGKSGEGEHDKEKEEKLFEVPQSW